MKEGRIYCQDTIPKLKKEFGKGFNILLKLKTANENYDEVDARSNNVDVSTVNSNDMELLSLLPDSSDPQPVKIVMHSINTIYRDHCTLKDKHLVSIT